MVNGLLVLRYILVIASLAVGPQELVNDQVLELTQLLLNQISILLYNALDLKV